MSDTHDNPINGAGDAAGVQKGTVEELLQMCGFGDAEIADLLAAKLAPWELLTAIDARLALRVARIEMWIAREIQDRQNAGGIVVPGGPGWRN